MVPLLWHSLSLISGSPRWNYTTDAYLHIALDLAKCATGTSIVVPPAVAIKLLSGVIIQSTMSASRCGQSLATGYVGDVITLRDVVLVVEEI